MSESVDHNAAIKGIARERLAASVAKDRRRHLYTALLLVAIASTGGCQAPRWQLNYLGASEALVIRVRVDGGETSAWLVGRGQGITMYDRRSPLEGTLEILDAQSCAVLASRALPEESTSIEWSVGMAGRPDEIIYAPGGTSVPPTPPNFTGCLP